MYIHSNTKCYTEFVNVLFCLSMQVCQAESKMNNFNSWVKGEGLPFCEWEHAFEIQDSEMSG